MVQGTDQSFYAVEKVHDKEYALCKLLDHIATSRILGLPKPPPSSVQDIDEKEAGATWWDAAVVPEVGNTRSTEPRKAPRLSLLGHTNDKNYTNGAESHVSIRSSVTMTAEVGSAICLDTAGIPAAKHAAASWDDATSAFVKQYLEMLYISKISVAYFAKTHLSRLRATAFDQNEGDDGLIRRFLADMIMTSSVSDRKYKNVWPDKLKTMVPLAEQRASDIDDNKGQKTNKRKKSKMKPNKSGLLPGEEDKFSSWWYSDDTLLSIGDMELLEVRFKRRSLSLRTREAFLQIIVMLEVAALELHTQHDADQKITEPANRKSHKGGLEILLDKLCIWHSLDHGPLADLGDKKDEEKASTPDLLRDFCVEVIVPLYVF